MMRLVLLMILAEFLISEVIGQVVGLEGKAVALRDKKEITLEPFDKIYQKDKIKVFKNSYIQISLMDKSLVTIGENSSFDFAIYNFSKNLQKRKFFSKITDSIQDISEERFEIKPKTSVIGVRSAPKKKIPLADRDIKCEIKLPEVGKLLSSTKRKKVYSTNKTQQEILEFYNQNLPREIVINNLALLPNGNGLILYLKNLKDTSTYKVEFIEALKKVTLSCGD